MWTYNDAYKSPLSREVETLQQAVDLSLFFPQLSTNKWGALWSDINRNKDTSSASFLVNLFATIISVWLNTNIPTYSVCS